RRQRMPMQALSQYLRNARRLRIHVGSEINNAITAIVKSAPSLLMACSSGLTSRAQARGTNQREPRSGTGPAIPRCLQRFDTPFKALVGFGYHLGRRAGSVTSTPRITNRINPGSCDPITNDRYEVLHFHHTIQLRN